MSIETENQSPKVTPSSDSTPPTSETCPSGKIDVAPGDVIPAPGDEEEQEFVVRNYKVVEKMSDRESWYSTSKQYWEQVPSTVDGMLGGYGSITHLDLADSAMFVAKLYTGLNTGLALDCGAGIGRITGGLLLNIFERVEMLDTCQEHLEQSRDFLGEEMFGRVAALHGCGMQDFKPEPDKYDLIWIQWVIIYLSDYDFIKILARFKTSLKKGGYIVIKDNVCKVGCELDPDDSSVTRSDFQLKQIFKKAGCELVHDTYQKNFPKELYKVKYYALR